MKKTTLVIMAAGMGSRFGEGIKQLEPMGPNGEIIMDYSIYDAVQAGFNKVVIVTRNDLLETMKEVIGNRVEKMVPVEYAIQELDNIPEGFQVPEGRKKPWGTGQAILSCKGIVDTPFLVINADDYYGKDAFQLIHDYLVEDHQSDRQYNFCMAGFILGNTLSDHGGVTRGICVVDENGKLVEVHETKGIVKTPEGAACEDGNGVMVPCDVNRHVSMNMWGFTLDFLDVLERGFRDFLAGLKDGDTDSEYLLPMFVDRLIQEKEAWVSVLETRDKWFGVTYKEDKPIVVESIKRLIAEGLYPDDLYQK
jgi:hypothetical protein